MAYQQEKDPTLNVKTNPRQPKWLTIPRIILGLILIYKGSTFLQDQTKLSSLFTGTGMGLFNNNSEMWALILTYAHLLGGFFIAIGLFTRWSCIALIPFIAGAIVFVNLKPGMPFGILELFISVLCFVLLVYFAWKGGGAISADEYFRNYTKAAIEPGHTEEFLS